MALGNIFTNPPSPNDLMFGLDRFSCRGTESPYSAVKSLRYFASQLSHYRNFINTGKTYETVFDIYLHDQPKPIRIRSQASVMVRLYGESDVRQQNAVRDTYLHLAEKTFPMRLRFYLTMLDQYGCFQYDGKRFFPDSRVTDGKRIVDLKVQAKDGKFLRQPFRVYVQLPKSVFGKVLNRLAQRDVGLPIKERDFGICTEYDADVFFTLMKRLYGIEWE